MLVLPLILSSVYLSTKAILLKALRKNIKFTIKYYEVTESVESAIAREKQLKKWHRDWKIRLI